MKLLKFRVKNYKSIIDSGDCYLNEDITILAGKNESGKTSLLEALSSFDFKEKIDEIVRPIQRPDSIPEITVTFLVEADTLQEVFTDIGFEDEIKTDLSIEITKIFPDNYSLSKKSASDLGFKNKRRIDELEKNANLSLKVIKKIHTKYPNLGSSIFEQDFDNLIKFRDSVKKFKDETAASLSNVIVEDERNNFVEALTAIQDSLNKLIRLDELETEFLNKLNKSWTPNFILFKSFEDIFPNKVPFEELESNDWIKDLALISDLDISVVKSDVHRSKHKHKKDINITLNDDYKKFWSQDLSNLSIDWESGNLFFWIEEDGYPYEPSLRSKGRQWHLAFYIRISARSRENVANIILIDEPGLFLHAQALKDILQKLEVASKEAQIIFSTHSPYLLEADKLSRIRLIHRTKQKGTKVENKIHALADKETLTPILTAIGLELSSGIANIDKLKNVVAEGASDVYYLEAFKKIINKSDINIVFGGGAGNMPFVGTILHGWGCKVLYLFDKDKGGKDGEKSLKDTWLVSQEIILSVLGSPGSIEDVFSVDDFKKFILKDETIHYSSSNSEYLKSQKRDKVLLAKLFLDSLNTTLPELSKNTKDNLNMLFDKLEQKFALRP